MKTAHAVLDPAFTVASLDRRIFGSFIEHMGRCVYTGIYEPGHPTADENGCRRDVLDLIKEAGVTTVRYPGGNFVSGYDWEDGIGPSSERPVRLDLAWQATETNEFGLAEFMRWAREAGVEPMLAVNLGTRGVKDAARMLEYCNHAGGTTLSDLRASHGSADPFGVKLWCLGNEMDGPWQLGHKTAEQYGWLARQTAQAIRRIDPDIELVACGSSNRHMPTFGEWEATVLDHAYDEVDYISLHAYYGQDGDLASFLACGEDMDAFIEGVVATSDHIRAKLKTDRRMMLSFDEWNVRRSDTFEGGTWDQAPRLSEEDFDVADAVAFGGMLISLLKHSDRVRVACQAQLVNLLGLIRAEPAGPAWPQTIFYPFAHATSHAHGEVLQLSLAAPTHETNRYGEVTSIDGTAIRDPETGTITLFIVNRHPTDAFRFRIELRGVLERFIAARQLTLADTELAAANTLEQPDRVTPRSSAVALDGAGPFDFELLPASWNTILLTPSSDC